MSGDFLDKDGVRIQIGSEWVAGWQSEKYPWTLRNTVWIVIDLQKYMLDMEYVIVTPSDDPLNLEIIRHKDFLRTMEPRKLPIVGEIWEYEGSLLIVALPVQKSWNGLNVITLQYIKDPDRCIGLELDVFLRSAIYRPHAHIMSINNDSL